MIVEQYLNSIVDGIIIKHAPCRRKKEKVQNPATRAAEEAVDRLEQPVLPEYLKGDDEDGPSGSEEEKYAQRMRSTSTSTTARSGRGTDPDDYDWVMGISSVQPSEMEGLVTGT